MDALETKKLTKEFGGVKAVNNLSISFEKGKIIGLIGPNGSGKTTLVNVLSGMLPIDGGTVVVSGSRELSKIRSHDIMHLGVTRTFQNVRLFEQMPVLDNVLSVITKRGILGSLFEQYKTFHESKAREVLERVGLWEKKNELVENLSYGQRKLLEIGRALAMDADIILFDEPYAGLFPEMVKQVSGIMQELKGEGKTVVLIEHDMAIIRELCDHVFVLDAGALLAEGTPEKVLKQKDVIEAYLGT